MSAEQFEMKVVGVSAKEAFKNAVAQAQYDYGHSGYTGTIAEKSSYVMFTVPEGKSIPDFIQEVYDKNLKQVDDKYGPAGCILLEKNESTNVYLFFGWAAS